MPIVSKRQNRFFRAHADENSKIGKVAREFIKSTKPGSIKNLPESKDSESKKSRGEKWYG